MENWESEREELLEFTALYADAMWDCGGGDYAGRVNGSRDSLDSLVDSLSVYSKAAPVHPGETQVEDAVDLLKRLGTAAADGNDETTQDLLSQLQTEFPVGENATSGLNGFLAALTERGEEDRGDK